MHRLRVLFAGFRQLFFVVFLAVALPVVKDVYATSPFSGLVVAQGEQGVKIVEIYPGCPADKAGLLVGDLIIEVDGQKIKTLEDFVNLSKARKDNGTETNLLLIRKGKLQNLLVVTYSETVFKEWKEKVPPPPESSIGGLSLFQYYLEKGKARLEENKQGGSIETQLARSVEAIKYFFYALHYTPTDVGVALLIADTYMKTAKLHLKKGQNALAVEDYGRASNLYEKCSKKHVTEKELELILAHLQEVEKELISLLPPEEQGTIPAKETTGSLSSKASP